MSDYDRRGRDSGDYGSGSENPPGRDYRHSDHRNRANMSGYDGDPEMNDRNIWSRSVDEVRSWFGDDEAERRRLRDEEERMRHEQRGSYQDRQFRSDDRGWDSARGYGSNVERDYGRSNRSASQADRDQSDPGYFRSSNEYGGSRNRDFYRDYPTHNSGRSAQNREDDEMKRGYEGQSEYHQDNPSTSPQHFGGRDYERNYPTRAERNNESHTHDHSSGWQSTDSHRGYRSLNNTGRTGIGQENQLGRDRDPNPNYRDKNYSHGDYTPNLNAGGLEYNSRHYDQRGRQGTAINDYAQRGYSEGYGRTGYAFNRPGNYSNSEVQSTRHPKNYKGNDDRIYVEVCEALGRELDASDIEVTASGSEITLTGSVGSRDEKRRAERIAERVNGVEDVHNRLTVSQKAYNDHGAQSRAATEMGNASRTDTDRTRSAADGTSQTEGAGSRSSGDGKTSNANGSGKGPSRK